MTPPSLTSGFELFPLARESGKSSEMPTIKSFKGYGKVDAADDREFRSKTCKRLILIVVSAILLSGDSSQSASSPAASSSIKVMCSVTKYPDSCYSNISSMKGSNATVDPKEIFKLAFGVAVDALSKVSSLSDTFLAVPTNDTRLKAALRDCKELFDDAIGQLNASLELLQQPAGGGDKLLTALKIDNLRAWLSAAVTEMETCLDGFEGTTCGFREKMEAAMVNSTQFTSNGLAIVARDLTCRGFRVHMQCS